MDDIITGRAPPSHEPMCNYPRQVKLIYLDEQIQILSLIYLDEAMPTPGTDRPCELLTSKIIQILSLIYLDEAMPTPGLGRATS